MSFRVPDEHLCRAVRDVVIVFFRSVVESWKSTVPLGVVVFALQGEWYATVAVLVTVSPLTGGLLSALMLVEVLASLPSLGTRR